MAVTITTTAFPRFQTWEPLRSWKEDRITGAVTASLSLSDAPIPPLLVFKNGTMLDENATPADYTVSGTTMTLNVAAIAGDVFKLFYHWRETRTA